MVAKITAREGRDAGRTVTSLGQLLNAIMDTRYIVTDNPAFGNGGGGGVDPINRTDTIYHGTIGEPDHNHPTNPRAATGWHVCANGLFGLVIHEAIHMTKAGDDFYARSRVVARQDAMVSGELYKSSDPEAAIIPTTSKRWSST